MKIKVTYTIEEYTEDYLTELYIDRLKSKHPHSSRSAIVSDAIKALWQELRDKSDR